MKTNVMRGRHKEHGNAIVVAVLGLIGVILAAMITKGYFDNPPPETSREAPTPLPAPATFPEPAAAPSVAKERTLSVYSPCNEVLRIATNHLDKSGDRKNNGFYEISPGAIVEIPTMYSYVFLNGKPLYYYTRTVSGAAVEEGSRQEIVGGKQVGMKRAKKELENGETTVLNMQCP